MTAAPRCAGDADAAEGAVERKCLSMGWGVDLVGERSAFICVHLRLNSAEPFLSSDACRGIRLSPSSGRTLPVDRFPRDSRYRSTRTECPQFPSRGRPRALPASWSFRRSDG